MTGSTLLLFALVCAALFMLGRRRALFPYLLVFVLGLEYFSPGAADSLFTLPKMGFLSLVLSQAGTTRISRVFTTRGLTFPVVVFVLYMDLTILWSVDPGRSLTRGISLLLLTILFVVVQGFVRTTSDVQAFWRAFLFYGLINAAMTFYQLLSGATSYVDETGGRAGGLGVNPTEGSFYTAIGMLILIAYFAKGLPIAAWMRRPIVQLTALGVLFVGLLATGSRGGIIGLVFAVLALIFHSGRTARQRLHAALRYLGLGVLIGGIVFALPNLSALVATRFAAVGADQLGNRLNIWYESWLAIVQHPVIGNGLKSTAIAMDRYAQNVTYSTHNTPLTVLLDGGVFGLLFFSLLVLRLVMLLRRMHRVGPREFQIHTTILTVVVLLAGLVMMSHEMMYNKLLWTLLGLVEGTRFLLRQQQSPHARLRERLHAAPAPIPSAR